LKKKAITLELIIALAFTLIFYGILPRTVESQSLGTIYIRADGNVEGTDKIQRNGNIYVLKGSISGPIIVERDTIVLDGAGYTLQGSNGRGVNLSNRRNVTVRNMQIKLEGGYSILLDNSSDCTIRDNTLTWNPQSDQPFPVYPISINLLNAKGNLIDNNTITDSHAIQIDWSQNNTITNNKIIDSRVGIDITASTGNLLRNNLIINCTHGFSLSTYSAYNYSNDVDTSNAVDGNPIIYWENIKNTAVPANAAYIALINCSKVIAKNASPEGVVLAFSWNCTLSQLTLKAGGYVELVNSSSILLSECSIQHGGLNLDGSSSNTITGCIISNNSGIRLANSNDNVIRNSNFTDNSYAIAPFQDTPSTGNLITGNVFSKNKFALTLQAGNTVSGNSFIGNEQGILFVGGSSTITENDFQNNRFAVVLNTQKNLLRNNSFSENTANLQVSAANFNNDVDTSNTVDGKPIIYWVDRQSQVVPVNAGLVVLVNCKDITVQNCILTKQDCGVILAFTQNCIIANNLIVDNAKGIYFYASSGNQIAGNNITGNGYAIFISGATFTFYMATGHTPSSGNVFLSNNFADNNQTVYDVADASNFQWQIEKPSVSLNVWDNGTMGNYWSDYNGTDTNGNGIGDTPYNVYSKNNDNYPLMKPVEIPVFPEPTPTPPNMGPTSPPNQENPLTQEQLAIFGLAVTVAVIGTGLSLLIYLIKRK
jgi:parallel beta-helix repeat protein